MILRARPTSSTIGFEDSGLGCRVGAYYRQSETVDRLFSLMGGRGGGSSV
jgi:hypothetical protein